VHRRYVGALEGKLADFDALEAAGDLVALAAAAHKLRGSAGAYGFSELSGAAGEIEDLLRDAGASGAPPPDQLRPALDRVRALIRQVVQRPVAESGPSEGPR
jgi:HPt (histidine-containing phosphotransfer) domain-containing protein